MNKKLIPTSVAGRLINAEIHADFSTANLMVLHEALALLVARLHCAGAVDGLRLLDDLQAAFSDPRVLSLSQMAPEAAQVFVARTRGAINGQEPPSPQ